MVVLVLVKTKIKIRNAARTHLTSTNSRSCHLSCEHVRVLWCSCTCKCTRLPLADPGGLGARPPAPRLFSKSCSFQAPLTKFWAQASLWLKLRCPTPSEQNPGSAPAYCPFCHCAANFIVLRLFAVNSSSLKF